jgi:hypothetical protein
MTNVFVKNHNGGEYSWAESLSNPGKHFALVSNDEAGFLYAMNTGEFRDLDLHGRPKAVFIVSNGSRTAISLNQFTVSVGGTK